MLGRVWLVAVVLIAAMSARGEEPDPAATLRAADDAVAKLSGVEYRVHAYGVGAQAARTADVKAQVQARRGGTREALPWKFLVRGESRRPGATAAGELATAYNGKVVRSLHGDEKVVVEAAPELRAEVMADGAGGAVDWLLRWSDLVSRRFGEDSAGDTPSRYEGKAAVGGVPCHVVYVDYSETADPNLFNAWWFIGVEDSLPRRLDMHLLGNGGDGFTVVEISELRAAPVEDHMLALAVPAGVQVRVVEAPKEEKKPTRGRGAALAVGAKAPDWVLLDPAGKEHKLADYQGKVVVMDFWATWCGPCIAAMPGLQKLHEKFAGKPVAVLGINCWESGDPVAMMKDKGFTYPLLLKGDEVARAYGVTGIPTFYVIGPDGTIVHSAVGFDPRGEEKLSAVIEDLLAKIGG